MVSILEVKKSIQGLILNRPDVVGVGISLDRQTIRVYVNYDDVTEPLPEIPSMMSGYPIELVESTGFNQLRGGYRAKRYRPVVGGISASHPDVTAGTIGGVVIDRSSGKKLLLSNTHVFANSDAVDDHRANVGDAILQPGSYDGGSDNDVVATLYKWVPFSEKDGMNIVDAALAMPVDQNMVSPYILADNGNDLIRVEGVKSVSSPIHVKKYSRTTNADRGVVIDWDFSVAVDYEDGKTHNFEDQILARIETEGGDSGSLLLDEDNYAVGLIFAGGSDVTGQYYGVANKIRTVLAMLGGDGVDVSDGLTQTSVTEPKPQLEVEDVTARSVSSSAIDAATCAGIVCRGNRINWCNGVMEMYK